MAEQINALLVHESDEAFQDLAPVLKSLSIEVVQARDCREATTLLKHHEPFDLVFAGIALRDGGWANVLDIAQQSKSYLPVIVVSRIVDNGLYLDTLERGAFDYITPPFGTSGLAHIVRSAIYKELVSAKQSLAVPPAA